MGILAILQKLMPEIKLPEHITVNLSILSGNTITTDKRVEVSKVNSDNVIEAKYYPSNNTIETNNLVKRALETAPPGSSILEDKSREKYQLLSTANTEVYQSTVNFFRGKVPAADIRVLEVANIVRVLMNKELNSGEIRNDIQIKYGVRGRNITNLFTAGYFESLLIPLYDELVVLGEATDFKAIYNRLIEDYHFAVFVGVNKKKETIKKEVLDKIQTSREIDSGVINIHGIGDSNIRAIKSCLSDLEIMSEMSAEPDFVKNGRIFMATIHF